MQNINNDSNSSFLSCHLKTGSAGSQLRKAGSFASRSILPKFAKAKMRMGSACKSVCRSVKNTVKRAVIGGTITGGIGTVATIGFVFGAGLIFAAPPVALAAAVTVGFGSAGAWAMPGIVTGACKPLIEKVIEHVYVKPALVKQKQQYLTDATQVK